MSKQNTYNSQCTHDYHEDGCGCGCTHNHQHAASRNVLMRIIVTAVCMIALHLLPVESLERPLEGWGMVMEGWGKLACYIAVYLFVGWNILKEAVVNIMHGKVFDENFLMVVATIGAFALAIVDETGDYDEAIAVMWLFQVGEYLLGYALTKSRESVQELAYTSNDYAVAESETFIRRFARYYTPVVCSLSLALIIVPPTVLSLCAAKSDMSIFVSLLSTWTYRALAVLVISCPCALVISIPMTFFAGIRGAKRCGIIINNSSCIEKLAKIKPENTEETADFVNNNANIEQIFAASDVNMAVVGVSSEISMNSADIVLMNNDKQTITQAIRISRKCMNIVWQNIIIAIGIKIVCLVLSAFGITHMWLAVFADTGVLILAVINAMRGVLVKK